jgi:hypothetical protein
MQLHLPGSGDSIERWYRRRAEAQYLATQGMLLPIPRFTDARIAQFAKTDRGINVVCDETIDRAGAQMLVPPLVPAMGIERD